MPKWEPVPHRFNYWLASNYWHDAPNIASRFWDCDPNCDWSLLACVWHIKNDFGRKIDPVFSVEEIYAASKKEGWMPGDLARIVHACWLGYVAEKQREQTDPIVILPPPPTPPPVVVEEPKPSLPEVKVPNPPVAKKTPWKLIATILAGVALVLKFTPAPAIVIGIIDWLVKILQAIPQ
jgi:hypothetical protein